MQFKRKCGILVHPTSFPSAYGIGDLGKNAYKFIDFLKSANQTLWQILPLGPTSFKDSPYQCFSAFAGNYYLLSPDIMIEEGLISNDILEDYPKFDEARVDYGKVINYKTYIYKKAFLNFTPDNDYSSFCFKNSYWLEDYCLFSAIKDYYIEKRKFENESPEFLIFCHETKNLLSEKLQKDFYYGGAWQTWNKELVLRDPSALDNKKKELKNEIDFYKFLQYQFFKQWKLLKSYANKNNVNIIGDIPIFVALDSADVWSNQNLFNLSDNGYPIDVAGVPPDYFSKTGQLWGNPLYKWEEHQKTNFSWWVSRIKILLETSDIIRIDHFRGFESYYSIPFGSIDAKNGMWKKGCGNLLFDTIEKEIGSLPIIAEDLGIITPEVTELRKSVGLPGMKVLQFAFDESENNEYLPHNYEKNCVVYTGTHDNNTSKGWYQNATEYEKDYFRRYTNSSGENVQWDLIRLAVSSAAKYAIYPLQDVLCLGEESRMNVPGTDQNNWQWRYTEEMLLPSHAEYLYSLTKIFKR